MNYSAFKEYFEPNSSSDGVQLFYTAIFLLGIIRVIKMSRPGLAEPLLPVTCGVLRYIGSHVFHHQGTQSVYLRVP